MSKEGFATPNDFHKCANYNECIEEKKINGHTVSVKFVDVATYTNAGSNCMRVEFEYTTGFEDTRNSNWNVEASVSGGFSIFLQSLIQASLQVVEVGKKTVIPRQ